MTISLQLWELAIPVPGITEAHGASLGEAAAVCLESQHHQSGVGLQLESEPDTASLHWRVLPEGAHRCYTGDRATEDGACAIAILLARKLTGQVVLFRSEKKEGCDYWLGPPDYPLAENGLKGANRIEVSGIRSGVHNFVSRCEAKRRQIGAFSHPSGMFISVVEFSTPRAILERL